MAVTKLMNIKSSPHGVGRHLYNSIRYIINPEKTKDGLLVGGNAGNTADEIYDVMLNTKRDWDKCDGRQGYHFVLSWKPGEVEPDTAYQLIKEFCEEYLGDDYDYVFSVHDDHDHTHGHIVFNSVSRNTGYKYRYEKGDWEKYIQPITDKICKRHGLSVLEYEKENRSGKSYAEYFAEKEGQYTWKKIIQADIDYMVSCSETWEDFLAQMQQIGYTFPRKGIKQGIGEYITFCAPGGHRRRSDSLGAGYSVGEIKERITNKLFVTVPENSCFISPKIHKCKMNSYQKQIQLSAYQKNYVRRYLRASTYFSRKNPYAIDQKKIRRDLLQINKLRQDCHYLLRNNIRSNAELERRSVEVKIEEKRLQNKKTETEFVKDNELVKEYIELEEKLRECGDPSADIFEIIQDQMEELEKKRPKGIRELMQESHSVKDRLKELREEKKIIRHIKQHVLDNKEVKTVKMTHKGISGRTQKSAKRGGTEWKKK